MRRCVIFDLDGTLTKSEEGIFNCALEACRQMGWPQPDAETLRRFVGPPLKYSFQHELGMTDSQADEAVRHYRARYQEVGLFENRVYPGIRRLLRALKARGVYLAIATGKPTGPSCRIAEHFGFARWMDRIVGPEDSADAGKAELIRSALPDDFDPDKDLAWMVGDRKFDIEGGQKVGISTIGVGYGYGSREELEAAGCDVYAGTVQELYTALLELTSAEETREIPEPRGAFLAMEGLDGSGKSTQISALTDLMDRYGYEVVHSREPGGCPISEKIRDLVLDPINKGMCDETEALLYAASRAQHVRDVIRPAIERGRVLLCDRFLDSSVAYQGAGRNLGVEQVLSINDFGIHGLRPDLTIYLDIPHEVALARRYAASTPDRMEMEKENFHASVEKGYLHMIEKEPERFVRIDATESAEIMAEKLGREVLRRLEQMEDEADA